MTYDEGEDAPRLPGLAADVGTPRVVVYPADASAAPIPFESDSTKREHGVGVFNRTRRTRGRVEDGNHRYVEEENRDERRWIIVFVVRERSSVRVHVSVETGARERYDDIVSSNHKRMKMVAFTKSGEACEKSSTRFRRV